MFPRGARYFLIRKDGVVAVRAFQILYHQRALTRRNMSFRALDLFHVIIFFARARYVSLWRMDTWAKCMRLLWLEETFFSVSSFFFLVPFSSSQLPSIIIFFVSATLGLVSGHIGHKILALPNGLCSTFVAFLPSSSESPSQMVAAPERLTVNRSLVQCLPRFRSLQGVL